MTGTYDAIVIGGGPAGTAAALEAASRGLRTLLIDEGPDAGGQVFRAPLPGLSGPPRDAGRPGGDALRAALAASPVTRAFNHRVWLVEPGFGVFALGPDGPASMRGDALIVATGALERHVPIPGWTLPGVVGLAAATLLLKSQATLPGRRVVVAGVGPLLPLVAAAIVKGGGKVAAVVDAASRRDWIRRLPFLAARPDLLAQGAGWIAKLMSAGVPILNAHALSRIEGVDRVEGARAVPLAASGAPRPEAAPRVFECDAVCYGFGLLPSTEITRLLGASHHYDPDLGGWSAITDADQRTDIGHLYVAGDGAGILGAAAAAPRGRLAGLAAARDLGWLGDHAFAAAAAPLRLELRRAGAFGRGMAGLARPKPATLALVAPDTVVCRCEDVTRRSLEDAITGGAVTMNDLKAATRCGMGPCGGRVCGDSASALIAALTGNDRSTIGEATGRPPLRPIPFDQIAGDFDYDDLPIPAPAPL